jgi:hypothetical protein
MAAGAIQRRGKIELAFVGPVQNVEVIAAGPRFERFGGIFLDYYRQYSVEIHFYSGSIGAKAHLRAALPIFDSLRSSAVIGPVSCFTCESSSGRPSRPVHSRTSQITYARHFCTEKARAGPPDACGRR